ncbi:MAG: Nif3-like dinuclear metal center hexameric protein [Eubacteriales bacterium]|nr:Nif3-like dinuclear metal center hexameric protein [Eubacteriales bacterium]
MIAVKDILHVLEQAAPYELAESWDNVGLLVGDPEDTVNGVLCALDITLPVVEEAVELGCNLILAHHPVIFTSVSRVTADTVTGKILIKMIQNGISGICMHTNMDCADAGVNDLLAASLGLTDVVSMGAGDNGALGRVGNLPHPMSLSDFADHVKTSLDAGGVRVADGGKPVSRVAVGGGACGKLMDYAVAKGADTFVIGDCSYDIMMRAHDIGLNLLDAGHFPTENPISYGFRDCIAEHFPETRVHVSRVHADCISFY